jgi:DNA-binding NarL/FixJ family response regulator
VAISAFGGAGDIEPAPAAGAAGYVLKSATPAV